VVAVTDVACRHCGTRFDAVSRRSGSCLNDFFRLLLGVWALALPVLCLMVGLASPKGWGDLASYLTVFIYFIPWTVGIISLLILTWLTQERR
jgi:fumarate reductase subunit D